MKISYNWLKQYIDTDLVANDAAEKLTLLGLEVEQIDSFGSDFDKFVVGEILEVRAHPNADRLSLCTVDIGSGEVQIVCGASNVASGQKVPVATTGATIPKPMADGSRMTIKKTKLRGEVSEGMICAEDELGLGEDHAGILVLDDSLKPGTTLKEALNIDSDTVFEIGLTPNRPDASCHIGVARDLAAVLEKKINNPYGHEPDNAKPLNDIDITIEETDKCHRYVGMMVENVTIKESPGWLQARLRAIGLRPINNVVDVTNYVLHEIGQPLHAFDYDKISGKKIVVRSFEKELTFTTLDDEKRTVPAGTLFICDGEKPVAVAGVMGGLDSEVSDATTTILIEGAWFNPSVIRKASKSLTLQTDSSYRFERGIDPNITLKAVARAAELIADLADGTIVDGYTDVHPVKTDPLIVQLRTNRINHLLGTTITTDTASGILSNLEIDNRLESDDILECTVPTFRPDITREVDLIEEVGRVFDYNNIPRPHSAPFHTPKPIKRWEIFNQKVKSAATQLQYKEISTNSLLSKKEETLFSKPDEQLHTLNPVSQEATTLRTTLLAGFLKCVQFNLNRNAKTIRLFETGHVYRKGTVGSWIKGIEEHSHLLLGLCGYKAIENWQTEPELYSVFDLKTDLESFLAQFSLLHQVNRSSESPDELIYDINNTPFAILKRVPSDLISVFDIELPVCTAEVDLTVLHNLGIIDDKKSYLPVSKFPPFAYDAAFIVNKHTTAGFLTDRIRQTAGEILHSVDVFDVFEGKNLGDDKKSIAFRFTFSDRNKTLNIKDVEPVIQKIVQVLKSEAGARLRS